MKSTYSWILHLITKSEKSPLMRLEMQPNIRRFIVFVSCLFAACFTSQIIYLLYLSSKVNSETQCTGPYLVEKEMVGGEV